MSFLLDTNAYFLLFQYPRPSSYFHLVQHIKAENTVSFYISEITSLEIHSVLGKYRRGSPSQRQQCGREIIAGNTITQCSNTWIHHGRRKMKPKVFRAIQKLISDIEAKRGNTRATVLKVDLASVQKARDLLLRYADRYSFGSHDALIAGSLVVARQVRGMDLTLVTSDKGFKAVLRDETIPFYDPSLP